LHHRTEREATFPKLFLSVFVIKCYTRHQRSLIKLQTRTTSSIFNYLWQQIDFLMPSKVMEPTDSDLCPVCHEAVDIFAIGHCDHPICYRCSTRMRVLCNHMYCPICRTDLNQVDLEIFLIDLAKFVIVSQLIVRENES
jgi:hypothetical protein